MDQNKIISALCYISLFFAPFLLPLIVYFVVTDSQVKYHAKRAFLSHLLPATFFIFLIIFGLLSNNMNDSVFTIFGFMALYMVISLWCIIWNIIQFIRVIR